MNLPGLPNIPGMTQTTAPGDPVIKPWQVGALVGITVGVATFFALDKKVKNMYVKGSASALAAGISFAIAKSITAKAQEKARLKALKEYFSTISMTAQQQGAALGYTPQQMQQMGITGQAGTPGSGIPTQMGTVYQGANYTPNVYKMLANTIYDHMDGWGANDTSIAIQFEQIKNEADLLSLFEAFGTRENWDLKKWIEDQLGDRAINRINKHFYKQNIPYAFSNEG